MLGHRDATPGASSTRRGPSKCGTRFKLVELLTDSRGNGVVHQLGGRRQPLFWSRQYELDSIYEGVIFISVRIHCRRYEYPCSYRAIMAYQAPIIITKPIARREPTAAQTIPHAQYADDITNFVQQAHAHVISFCLPIFVHRLTSSSIVCQYVNHDWWLDWVSVLLICCCDRTEQKYLCKRRC